MKLDQSEWVWESSGQNSVTLVPIYVAFVRALKPNIRKIVIYKPNQSSLREQKSSMITLIDPLNTPIQKLCK